MSEKVILPDDPRAATYRTDIKGWVSAEGKFFGDHDWSEREAREHGATHKQCECGGFYPIRSYPQCCIAKREREKYERRKIITKDELIKRSKEWGEAAVTICDFNTGEFFRDLDDVKDNCWEDDIHPRELMLVETGRSFASLIDPNEYFVDELPPEDGEVPNEIAEAFAVLNEVIRNCEEPLSYFTGKRRVDPSIWNDWEAGS